MTDVDEQLRLALDYGTQQYVSLCKAQDRYTVAEARIAELEAALGEMDWVARQHDSGLAMAIGQRIQDALKGESVD